jgi:hypothetical protein
MLTGKRLEVGVMRRLFVCGTVIALVALVLAACGDGDEAAGTTTLAPTVTTRPTTTTRAPTTTQEPTTTEAPVTTSTEPPTTTTTQATTTTELPLEAVEPVDVVFSLVVDASTNVAASTFTASGPAADDGVVCAQGTGFESSFEDMGNGREVWDTRMQCGDGSGNFTLEVDSLGSMDAAGEWTYTSTWIISNGTEAYEGMSGEGSGEGTCTMAELTCVDESGGQMWRDS